MSIFSERVYAVVRKIPAGRVMTYGQVAAAAGYPGAARAVGTAMAHNPHSFLDKQCPATVPCHRVVAAGGRLGGFTGGVQKKIVLLRREGVVVTRGKVDLT